MNMDQFPDLAVAAVASALLAIVGGKLINKFGAGKSPIWSLVQVALLPIWYAISMQLLSNIGLRPEALAAGSGVIFAGAIGSVQPDLLPRLASLVPNI